jgi:Fic family protein
MENTLKKVIDSIEELNALKPIKAEVQKILDAKIRLEFNFNSNHLEGNTLTYGETELLLKFDKTTGNHEMREFEEMKAHDVAFKLIQEWSSDVDFELTETKIRELNEIILVKPFWKDAETQDGQKTRRLIMVGQYKEHPNSVRLQNGEIFEYASPIETPIKMAELIEWYRKEIELKRLHPIELAAMLHHKFVLIHPFDDGNGRISRLLINYVLLKNNLPPIVIKTKDKKNYLNALNQADVGNMPAFIKYIAEQLVWSLNLYINAINGISIADEDDLDKEISVFKKELILNESLGGLKKTNKIIAQIYFESVKFLLDEITTKHQQFDELFSENLYSKYLNNRAPGINPDSHLFIDDTMNFILEKSAKSKFMFNNNELINSLSLNINHKGFLRDGLNLFDVSFKIQIKFDDYSIHIGSGSIKNYSYSYNHPPSKSDIYLIVNEIVKSNFSEIKKKIGKK